MTIRANAVWNKQFRRQGIINNHRGNRKAGKGVRCTCGLTTLRRVLQREYVAAVASVFRPGAIERSSMNSWDDKNFRRGDRENGRKKIVLTGLWTEVCVAFPAVQAIHDGYEVYDYELPA